jgi:hyperosmotically inducible protein
MKFTHAWMILAAAASLGLPALAEMTNNQHRAVGMSAEKADNTGRNVRDRDSQTLTPIDQGNTESDLKTTKLIRKAIMDVKDLSMNARNVKIITDNGQVTLRGPVKSADEKRVINEIAKQLAKDGSVDNQLEVAGEAKDKADAGKNL